MTAVTAGAGAVWIDLYTAVTTMAAATSRAAAAPTGRGGAGAERRVRQHVEGLRHGGSGIARSRDRHG